MTKTLFGAVALLFTLLPSPVRAAAIVLDGSGELAGATGVMVGANLYDVSFLDGTCAALFTGCDQLSDFRFTTLADAQAAGQALLDQVINVNPSFDASPALTAGCSSAISCVMYTPYAVPQPSVNFLASGANNSFNDGNDVVAANGTQFGINDDFSGVGRESFVFARWSPANGNPNPSAVPEPASLLLLGSGLSATGFFRRRKDKK